MLVFVNNKSVHLSSSMNIKFLAFIGGEMWIAHCSCCITFSWFLFRSWRRSRRWTIWQRVHQFLRRWSCILDVVQTNLFWQVGLGGVSDDEVVGVYALFESYG